MLIYYNLLDFLKNSINNLILLQSYIINHGNCNMLHNNIKIKNYIFSFINLYNSVALLNEHVL